MAGCEFDTEAFAKTLKLPRLAFGRTAIRSGTEFGTDNRRFVERRGHGRGDTAVTRAPDESETESNSDDDLG